MLGGMPQPSSSRRDFLRAGALAATTGWLGCAGREAALDSNEQPPNIVFLMADDLGVEAIGCYGGTSYRTPNLDRLAATGVRFTHAYAQPLCTPTRLQVMTGQYNYRNWKAFGILDPSEKTFGHVLQEAGYKTAITGKWQLHSYNPPDFEPEFRGLGMRPEDAGFDDWFLWHARHTEEKGSRYADPVILDSGEPTANTAGKYGPDLYAKRALEFMKRHREEPFFIYYPMALTHGPFNPTPNSADWETGDRFASDPEKYFGDMVEYTDEIVGRIADGIDELGLAERTLLIFFTDNGSPRETASMMGDRRVHGGKGSPTDAGTRVPLIARWKGVTPEGRVVEDLVDSTDVYATILDAAGATHPSDRALDGVSFLPQLEGRSGAPKEEIIVWHDPRPGAMKEAFTRLDLFARDRRYKLYDDGRLYDVPNDPLEASPIPEEGGSAEAEAARRRLRVALDRVPEDKRAPRWDPYAAFR